MATLFQGAPQTATSYTTSSTETPKWMQDAIYNQIQLAQNVANTPFQAYNAPTVAELSPLQQKAYADVVANQGAGQAELASATKGMAKLTGGPGGAAAAKPYYTQALATSGLSAAQPYLTEAATAMRDAAGVDTAEGLTTAQNKYLSPENAQMMISSGQDYTGKAGSATEQALGQSSLDAANPYLQAASQTAAGGISGYMNPYNESVTNQIAKLGARNLTENLLPGVSDAFIRSGSFGGTRMGEFGSRALRDTQEAVLAKQAEALQSGYGQAMSASQADLTRQAGLASTAGSLSGSDTARMLTAAGQYGNLGQAQTTAGQAQQTMGLNAAQAAQQAETSDASRLLASGQAQGSLGSTAGSLQQGQQQALLTAGSQMGALTGADLSRQQGALGQVANMGKQAQAMKAADVASLEAAGAAQQQQQQLQLNAAKSQFDAEQLYAKQQLDWQNSQIRGMASSVPTSTTSSGTTTGATYSASPLSQVATGLYTYQGLNALPK